MLVLSIIEAEYIATLEGAKEMWLQQPLFELGSKQKDLLYNDRKTAIHLA